MGRLEVWYSRLDVDELVALMRKTQAPEARKPESGVRKARAKTSLGALNKLTAVIDGQRRIVDSPPLIEHLPERSRVSTRRSWCAGIADRLPMRRARCSSATAPWIGRAKWSVWAASGRMTRSCCCAAILTATRCAGRRWQAVMLAQVTGSRSARTSDAQTPLTARSLRSPSPTQIRPTATTRPLPTGWAPESSRPLGARRDARARVGLARGPSGG
jgi:Uncharacterized protein conserved in bacteria (DUF2252)